MKVLVGKLNDPRRRSVFIVGARDYFRESVRLTVEDTGHVYVKQHASRLRAAYWLAQVSVFVTGFNLGDRERANGAA